MDIERPGPEYALATRIRDRLVASRSRRSRPSRLVTALVALAALQGCAGAARASAPAAAVAAPADSIWVRDELFFGSHIQNGGLVSTEQWEAFLDREVTPRFPEGLTSLEATGRYRYRTGEIVREPGHILILFYRPGPENEASVVALMEAYRSAFAQESVLRVTTQATVRFHF